MSTSRVKGLPRSALPSWGTALVVLLTAAVAAIEALLFHGMVASAIYGYLWLLVVLSLVPLLLEQETPIFQAFALIPVFRLVNLTMPVFIELTLFWFPLIYGPLVPVFVYIGRRTARSGPSIGGEPETADGESRNRDDALGSDGALAEVFDRFPKEISAAIQPVCDGNFVGDRFDSDGTDRNASIQSAETTSPDDRLDASAGAKRDSGQGATLSSVIGNSSAAVRRMREMIGSAGRDGIDSFSFEGLDNYLSVDEFLPTGSADSPRLITFDDAVPAIRPVETDPVPLDPEFDDAVPAIRPVETDPVPLDPEFDGTRPAIVPLTNRGSPGTSPAGQPPSSDDGAPWSSAVRAAAGRLRAFLIGLWTAERSTLETAGIGYGLPWWLGGQGGGKVRWLLQWSRQFLVPNRDRRTPMWLLFHVITRMTVLALAPIVLGGFLLSVFLTSVYLAEFEYGIITPAPLIPSLHLYQLVVLTLVMIGFVGFVEELLFRGIIQKVLEAQLGTVPGLLLASGLFGLMHSVYGLPTEMLFAGAIGLVFGAVYDVTDSLALVSVIHGLVNVFLFGIIPLDGASSLDLLRSTAVSRLEWVGADWAVDLLTSLGIHLVSTVP